MRKAESGADGGVRRNAHEMYVAEHAMSSTHFPPIAPLMAVSSDTSWPRLGVATGAFPPALF